MMKSMDSFLGPAMHRLSLLIIEFLRYGSPTICSVVVFTDVPIPLHGWLAELKKEAHDRNFFSKGPIHILGENCPRSDYHVAHVRYDISVVRGTLYF